MTNHTEAMTKWLAAAQQITTPQPLRVPVWVLLGEGPDVARAAQKYWEPKGDRLGLKQAGPRLRGDIPIEVITLVSATQDSQSLYQLSVDQLTNSKDILARGTFVLSELTAVLDWHFDDGIEDETDAQLANLKQSHKDDTASADSLAQALHDYATLADSHKADLDGLGGFKAALIAEAFELATKLGAVTQAPPQMSEASRAALTLRDQMVTLLWQRMSLLRAAATFVFRDQPAIVKEFTSSYERKKRAQARRKKAAASSRPA